MNKQPILGIDVSKDELVIFDSLTGQIVKAANNEKELKKLISSADWSKDYQVGVESTGDYSFLLMKVFFISGLHR